jgi:hypothetical protein
LSLQVYAEDDSTFDATRRTQQASPGYADIAGLGDAAFKGTLGVSKGEAEVFFRVGTLTFQLLYGDPSVGSPTASTPADIDRRLSTEGSAIVPRASGL